MILRKLKDTGRTEFFTELHEIILPDGVIDEKEEG